MNLIKLNRCISGQISVKMEWPSSKENEPNAGNFKLQDAPKASFHKALDALKKPCLEMCEILDLIGSNDVAVSGLSIKHLKEGRIGITVSVARHLAKSNSPLNITSPYKEQMPEGATDDGTFLDPKTVKLIETLEKEVALYMNGDVKQLQFDLFGKEEEGAKQKAA